MFRRPAPSLKQAALRSLILPVFIVSTLGATVGLGEYLRAGLGNDQYSFTTVEK